MTDTTEDIQEPVADEPLRAPGLKALQSEREAREVAEQSIKALQDKLDAIEAEKLTDLERAQKLAEDATAAAAEKDAEVAKAHAEVLRWRIAARHGISDEDAELFRTGTSEDHLTRQAERLAERATLPKGARVPGVGRIPDTPPSLDAQIRSAEASGDTAAALALKAQRLAEIAGRK